MSKLRIVLVGNALDRGRIRPLLPNTLDLVGEVTTMEAGRRLRPDALVVVPAVPAVPDVPDVPDVPESLTPRELEVLTLLAEGLPNKAIAARLRISDQTVKFHVASICGKLGVANRTSAVRAAIRRGWLTF